MTVASDRLFAILSECAAKGEPCPRNDDLAESIGASVDTMSRILGILRDEGKIALDTTHGRRIAILSGEHAGKCTGATITGPRQSSSGTSRRPTEAPAQPAPDPPRLPCAWCGGKLKPRYRSQPYDGSCCCVACSRAFQRHGWRANKATVEARMAHLATQPKGAQTVADFLRAGGVVYTEPAYRAEARR